jgi:leader peptidase (prepilin peptidase)/N-methyltransferase
VTTTETRPIGQRARHVGYACAVVPLLRWLIAVHAVPAGQPWRYRCPGCTASVWPAGCTPSGRCRACGTRIGAPPYAVEAVAVGAFVVLAWTSASGWELAAHAWWTAGMLTLAFIDAAVLRLPHRLTIATTAGAVLMLLLADAPVSSWRGGVIGAAALAGGYALIRIVSGGDLGPGDVAVAVPIGLVLGWHDWRLIIAAALLGHALAVAAIPIRRLTGRSRRPVPLGTYLIVASFIVLAAAGILWPLGTG